MMRLAPLLVLFIAAVPLWTSCKGFETNLQDTEVDYLPTARQNFEAGEAAMEDESFNRAIKFFEYVKNKFPYSRFAVLADLAVADCHFEREEWLEAADTYRLFARFHPSHEKVPYATFRTAVAYYKEVNASMFDDWSVPYIKDLAAAASPFPPEHERDQTAIKDSVRSFDEFLTRFPDDENVPEAKTLRIEARTMLAQHDIYAADFYTKRSKYRGAMWRYIRVVDNYGDTPVAAEALLEAARIADEELSELLLAQRLYARLAAEYAEVTDITYAQTRADVLEKEIDTRRSAGTLDEALLEPWDPRGAGPYAPPRRRR